MKHVIAMETIVGAMERRRVLSFSYDGQPRIVAPHALIREGLLRLLVLHAWQLRGGSNTRSAPCWGNFHLSDMTSLTELDEIFDGARPDFNPQRFKHVIHSL